MRTKSYYERQYGRAKRKIAELENANAALKCLMHGDPYAVKVASDGITATVGPHWACKVLVHSLTESLGDAPNFVVVDIGGETPATVTIQRTEAGTITPSVMLVQLRAENAELRDCLHNLRPYLDKCAPELAVEFADKLLHAAKAA